MTTVIAFLLMLQSQVAIGFPQRFHGVWDASLEACEGRSSDIRIEIDDDGISYWESDGTPVELLTASETDIAVTLAMSGEGENWRVQQRFVIDSLDDRLFVEAMPQQGEEFHKTIWFYDRCPAGTPMGW